MREMMRRCDTMRKEYEEKLEQFYRSYPSWEWWWNLMREMMRRCDTMRKEYEEKLEQFYRSYPIMRMIVTFNERNDV